LECTLAIEISMLEKSGFKLSIKMDLCNIID
jgi:hypothetical protein